MLSHPYPRAIRYLDHPVPGVLSPTEVPQDGGLLRRGVCSFYCFISKSWPKVSEQEVLAKGKLQYHRKHRCHQIIFHLSSDLAFSQAHLAHLCPRCSGFHAVFSKSEPQSRVGKGLHLWVAPSPPPLIQEYIEWLIESS